MLGDAMRRVWTAALVGAVVVALGACGGDDDEESTGTTAASTTSAPSTSTTNPRGEVEAAYLAYWDAYLEAVTEPVKPELPELQQLVTGAQKTIVTRNLRQLQARGEAVRQSDPSHYRHIVRAVDRSNGGASIEACVYDDLITYDVATGTEVDSSVAWKRVHAQLVHYGDRWLISYLEIGLVNGSEPCAST
jgi:hypothetical protein